MAVIIEPEQSQPPVSQIIQYIITTIAVTQILRCYYWLQGAPELR